MSLLSILSFAAMATAAPVHSVAIEHRDKTYDVQYHARIETQSRDIGMAAPTRTGARSCVVTANVSVERMVHTQDGAHALGSVLPITESFKRTTPGKCGNNDKQIREFQAARNSDIKAFITRVADEDRPAVYAALDSARALAAN